MIKHMKLALVALVAVAAATVGVTANAEPVGTVSAGTDVWCC